ncbi:arfaptin-1-like [Engraulis encrasicolus]|uniref:arfaptin-1-like n=1 Tax=Engraulis encrasicolus TaxID=184585 RepID=UPI002FD3E315
MDDALRSLPTNASFPSNGRDQSHQDMFQRDLLCMDSSFEGAAYTPSPSTLTDPISPPYEVPHGGEAPVTSPSGGGGGGGPVVINDSLRNPTIEKLERVRKWSVNTYKCTRQMLSEKLGRGSRTVDLNLEASIEKLRDLRSRYDNVTKLAQTLASQTAQVTQTQKLLGDVFADLSIKTPELHEEFGFNADTQKFLSKNGETLLKSINSFTAGMNTLVNQTIEDTMVNVKQYENARIEYDAYRTDLEELNMGPRDAITLPKIEQAQMLYQQHRQKYERMRDDLTIKLKLLEENRVKVLQKQLILLHSAVAAYYAGNQEKLNHTLHQLHSRIRTPDTGLQSWLEDC